MVALSSRLKGLLSSLARCGTLDSGRCKVVGTFVEPVALMAEDMTEGNPATRVAYREAATGKQRVDLCAQRSDRGLLRFQPCDSHPITFLLSVTMSSLIV